MDIYQGIAIGLYFLLMIAIGFYSYRKSTSNVNQFLLGDRRLGAAVTALSAGAADMSGWLLMGVPGAMYVSGVSSSWIAIGLTIGAFMNYILVAPRLRIYTERAQNAITIPDFFEKRFQDHSRVLRFISAVVILVFFTLYTSSGMVSGGRLFESAFEMPYMTGLFMTSSVVVFYTFLGGFLAVSLTDFVQGAIMFVALVLVPVVVFFEIGGVGETILIVQAQNPSLLNMWDGVTAVTIVSLLAWGLGYFGQPHILVRFMAIERVSQLKSARRIGVSWMITTMAGALLVGLTGIAYMSKMGQSIPDPETIFIYFSQVLFHPFVGGFLLAAILAAVMSTISSQLLVTSSSVTEDFYKAFLRRSASDKELLVISRVSVIAVAVVAVLLSLNPQDTILNLVGHAWAGFGAAFGPVMLLSLMWRRVTRLAAIAGMLVGGLTVLFWIFLPHNLKDWYEIIPGFLLASLTIVVVSLLDKQLSRDVVKEFDEVQQELRDSY